MTTIVETRSGQVRGRPHDGVVAFLGIPYAASPSGDRRWAPPAPEEPWTGVRDAVEIGPMVPQRVMPIEMFAYEGPQSEADCLTVNVWTPAADGARRPVMVWIHGGAYVAGAGSAPAGSALARNEGAKLAASGDVVVVTFNYRFGLLGFLRLVDVTDGAIPATGNEGLLDQIAALEWVRDNIAAFGGDPDNVTIFGASAGGMSVGALLAVPRAQGLFHKAIVQSGGAHMCNPVERANAYAERLLRLLGVEPDNVDGLRKLSPEDLLDVVDRFRQQQTLTPDPTLGKGTFLGAPVVDGELVPELPIDAVRSGKGASVPLLVGNTRDEWRIFSLIPAMPDIDEALLPMLLSAWLGDADPQPVVDAYADVRRRRGEPAGPSDLYYAIESDRNFRMPGVRLAEAHRQAGHDVYAYLFTWESPAYGGTLGSCHGLCGGFVFGTYADDAVAADFSGSGPAAERLSAVMQAAWTSFARTGNPSTEATPWPLYGPQRTTVVLDAAPTVVDAPREEERAVWDELPDAVIGGFG